MNANRHDRKGPPVQSAAMPNAWPPATLSKKKGANDPGQNIIRLAGFVAAVVAASSLSAQQPSPGTRNVALNVIALDSQGNAVDDLTAADFQVADQGKPQRIVSFVSSADPKQLSAASKPGGRGGSSGTPARPLVILFDLLNANLSNRGFGKDEIERGLEHMESSDFVYLYLLTNSGDLYPVHQPPSRTAEAVPDTAPWTAQIQPMLEDAINKVYGLRPVDESQMGIRIESTYKALDLIASVIGPTPGGKNIIWITRGVPTIVRLRGGEPYDYSPRLQRLATAIDRAGISITVVDEGSDAASGSLGTLEQFTELTGGQITRGVEKAISTVTTAALSAYRIEYVQPSADDKFHKIKGDLYSNWCQARGRIGAVVVTAPDFFLAYLFLLARTGSAAKAGLDSGAPRPILSAAL